MEEGRGRPRVFLEAGRRGAAGGILPFFLFFLFSVPFFPSSFLLRSQERVSGLFRPSERARRAALSILLRRGGPAAGAGLVKFLERETSPALRMAALKVLKTILPPRQAGPLDALANKEEDPVLKKAMKETARLLRLAGELETPGLRRRPFQPSREDRAALARFVGKRRLAVRFLGPRRRGERVLVRAWSPRLGLWFPRGPAAGRRSWGYRPFPVRFAKADREGTAFLEVPGGPLVVAAWTPRALAWTWAAPSDRTVLLRADLEKWGDLGKWKGRAAFLEAWPSGPRPSPGFPAWRVRPSGRFRFFCCRENLLDLLIRVLPQDPGGHLSSRFPGLLAFLRRVGPGSVKVGGIGRLALSGASRKRISSLWVELSPELRPDLARRIPFPPGGGLLALTAGNWRAAPGWKAPGAGTLLFHPRGLHVKPGGRAALATLPLRMSVYALPERRLGLERDALTAGALFRTPGGTVLHAFFPEKGGEGILLRAYDRIVPLLSLETDRLGRASLEDFSSLGKSPGNLLWKVQAPFLSGPPLLVRSQSLRRFQGKRFVLLGPSALERAAPPFLAMADRAFRTASAVVTGRTPAWDQVPVLSHNFLPPGEGASAGGGATRRGRMNFLLHDLLSVALPTDFLVLPWVHEQGHKLGYPHGPGMAAQSVETLWTLAGEEGVECSGRFACPVAWDLVQGRKEERGNKLLEAFSLYRRRYGGNALRRFLHDQGRYRWLLEGEGLSETAGAVAALCRIAGERVDGWFRALGWDAPGEEVKKGLDVLGRVKVLPPNGLAQALGEFRTSLAAGKDPGTVLEKVRAIRTHKERALAALLAARRLRPLLSRAMLKTFLEEALREGAGTFPDTGRFLRRRALAAWVRE